MHAHDDQSQPAPAPREEQDNMQMDDINIPLVAVSVAFFGALLAVTIISLQAWFYNYQAAERQAKILPRDDPRTELGALWEKQRLELHDPQSPKLEGFRVAATAPATGSAPAIATAPKKKITIDEAITMIAKDGE